MQVAEFNNPSSHFFILLMMSVTTIYFIDEQLESIQDSLKFIEDKLEILLLCL